MKLNINKLPLICAIGMAAMTQSCSLEEVNPGGGTFENAATTPEGMETMVNNCYFGMERKLYNDIDFMAFMEANTDLWTYAGNQEGKNDKMFMFFRGATPDISFTNNIWNSCYDGIGSCNRVLVNLDRCQYKEPNDRNITEAKVRFMRAVYYYNLVEIFGGVVKQTEAMDINYAPVRTEPVEIYRDIIIPDLQFAVQNLEVGTDATMVTPTKKAALGFLTKACLQSRQYTDEFLQTGFDAAKELINDCENGGTKYGAYMYPTYEDVFKEANNLNNKEALYKYNIYSGADGNGSSNGNYRTNRNNEHFLCNIYRFAAIQNNQEAMIEWGKGIAGDFMPTAYLLKLFQNADGSLDPRFTTNFNREWTSNVDYTWTEGDAKNYKKDTSIVGTKINKGDVAIKIVMPQDANYAAEMAAETTSPYIVATLEDIYDGLNVITMKADGSGENMFRYIYPSLTKHNSSNYYVVNAGKKRNGNLNAVLVMRMAEVYLIAAEYDLLLNGGSNAAAYVNKVRSRAGAANVGSVTIRTLLDERARELCGEFTRFYDLKRMGMFKDDSYLKETHPFLANYFSPNYALRPIPQGFTNVISNGDSFQNPGY